MTIKLVQIVSRWSTPASSKLCRHYQSLSVMFCGAPQGSVLGPMLFLQNAAGLLQLIRSHGLRPHLDADDTLNYEFCASNWSVCIEPSCMNHVAEWGMRSNRLQLHAAKTKVLWSTTSRHLHQLPQSSLHIGVDLVAYLSMKSHHI